MTPATDLPARLRAQADRRDAILRTISPAPWRVGAPNYYSPALVALRNSAECETATWRAMADALAMGHSDDCGYWSEFTLTHGYTGNCNCFCKPLSKAALALVERLEAQA